MNVYGYVRIPATELLEMNDIQLLTVREIEGSLRLGHTKTAELIREGEIKTLKIGSRRMATPEALQDFIQKKLEEQS